MLTPMLTILTLTPLPFGGYTGKIIINGCMYAGTFAGEMMIGNQTINFNIAPGRATGYGIKN